MSLMVIQNRTLEHASINSKKLWEHLKLRGEKPNLYKTIRLGLGNRGERSLYNLQITGECFKQSFSLNQTKKFCEKKTSFCKSIVQKSFIHSAWT